MMVCNQKEVNADVRRWLAAHPGAVHVPELAYAAICQRHTREEPDLVAPWLEEKLAAMTSELAAAIGRAEAAENRATVMALQRERAMRCVVTAQERGNAVPTGSSELAEALKGPIGVLQALGDEPAAAAELVKLRADLEQANRVAHERLVELRGLPQQAMDLAERLARAEKALKEIAAGRLDHEHGFDDFHARAREVARAGLGRSS